MNVDLLLLSKVLIGGRDAWSRLADDGILKSSFEGEGQAVHDWIAMHVDAGSFPTYRDATEHFKIRWPSHSEFKVNDLVDHMRERMITNYLNDEQAAIQRLLKSGHGNQAMARMTAAAARAEEMRVPAKQPRTLLSFGDKVKETYNAAKKGSSGFKTPWNTLNRIIGGVRRRSVFATVARPGIGKTSSGLLIARECWLQGARTGVLSPEMYGDELCEPFCVVTASVPWGKVVGGKLSAEEEDRFFSAIDSIKGLDNLWVLDPDDDLSPDYIDRWIRQLELDVVCWDSFYEMNMNIRDERERLDFTSNQIKASTRMNKHRDGVAGVANTQFKRTDTGSGGDEGTLEAIAGSDMIARRFQHIWRLFRKDTDRANKLMRYAPMKGRRIADDSEAFVSQWDWDKCIFDEVDERKPRYRDATDEF